MTDIQPTSASSAEVRARARRRLAPGTLAQRLALIAKRCGGEVVLLPGDRATLTGTPGEIGQLLAGIRGSGQLVSSTTPVPTGVPGQVLVNVRLAPRVRTHAARQTPAKRKRSRRAIAAIAAGALALLAGLAWLLYAAVTIIVANLWVVLLVLGAVVVAVALSSRAVSGSGKTFSGTFKGRVD